LKKIKLKLTNQPKLPQLQKLKILNHKFQIKIKMSNLNQPKPNQKLKSKLKMLKLKEKLLKKMPLRGVDLQKQHNLKMVVKIIKKIKIWTLKIKNSQQNKNHNNLKKVKNLEIQKIKIYLKLN